LPIFPLRRRRRVIDFCPTCQRHREMTAAEWNRLREEALAPALAALEATPASNETASNETASEETASEDAALAAIEACSAFFDRDALPVVAEKVSERLAGNPRVQAALGAALSRLSFPAEAEAAFRASLAAEDSPGVREQFAL